MVWGIGDEVRYLGRWCAVVAWSRLPGGPRMLLLVDGQGLVMGWVREG